MAFAGLLNVALNALAYLGEPSKIARLAVVLVGAVALLALGTMAATPGYGLLTICALALLSLVHVLRVAGRPDAGTGAVPLPSAACASAASAVGCCQRARC